MKYLAVILALFSLATEASPPALQLANVYHNAINLDHYWVSEKYDGVRAYWDGGQLLSRQGNRINAPEWFTEALPELALDGELWIGRGRFEQLSGIVRRRTPQAADWRDIKYMVFDLPGSPMIFDDRLRRLQQIIGRINQPHVRLVDQQKITTQDLLMRKLDEIVAAGGEGLMLHRGSSIYKGYRSDDLLKLKRYADAEAKVVGHFPGKGKYQGMLGSILVETDDNKRFKIGSGFSDNERKNPPPIGARITYKYFGLSGRGIPRFASFLRIRQEH